MVTVEQYSKKYQYSLLSDYSHNAVIDDREWPVTTVSCGTE